MSDRRTPKKSESLEIRLSYPAKQAFMAYCQARGCSASEALRAFIDTQLSPPNVRPKRRWRYLAVGGLAAAALGAMAAPSLARPAAAASFETLDANHDGFISPAEFTRAGGRTGRP